MKRREFSLAAAAAALPASLLGSRVAFAQAGAPAAGKDYLVLKQPAPVEAPAGKVEVVEFFSYGCSHCMHFEPIFGAWKKSAPKDIVVRLEHVGFQSSFEPLQRIYYALEALGKVDAVHAKVFSALQTERLRLDKPEVLFPWVEKQGVDRAKFEAAYKSFGTASKIRRAIQLQEAYKVEGTPALGIAGKYYTDGTLARGFEQMLRVTETLAAQEKKK